MTIASAFNDIAVEQGGTAAKSGAITAAIDALNDALAGSDQPQAKTIEQAVRLLGEHIGGGGGGTEYNITCYDSGSQGTPPAQVDSFVYKTKVSVYQDPEYGDTYYLEPTGEPISSAMPGECLALLEGSSISYIASGRDDNSYLFPSGTIDAAESKSYSAFIMPAHDIVVCLGR